MSEETPKKGIQKILDFIEKHPITISVIIPEFFLIIGGIYQIKYLWNIGLPYLRFFSLTQLLSDSILILIISISKIFLVPIIGMINYYVALWIMSYFKKDKTNIDDYTSIIVQSVILSYIFYLIFSGQVNEGHFETILSTSIIVVQYFIGAIVAASLINRKLTIGSENKDKDVKFNTVDKNAPLITKVISYIMLTFSGGLFLFGFLSILYYTAIAFMTDFEIISKNFLPNNDLKNYQYIERKYKPKGLKDSVLYFNDNFIFVELKKDTVYPDRSNPKKKYKKTIKKIEVLKFDEFFEK